ncbi:Eukaryotic translation initiation factor 4E-4 [Tritrichomonas foetus]|uniref:Eukaryotic translation initiation factor 4E-4 n=1 Tax=Tritrichomonas foetus TaxID=1144522 RepID=A0A1J4K3M6_9EUKA|nr:Eukaryotic translation initiation factor 4E-4 [Tritrichomonas foetus]|eukprot:OHT06049.1 Eukaryotic translation initiation factor 4E-4 [Tritrichomonas foetus]
MTHLLATPWTFYYFEKSEQPNSDISYDKCIHKIGKVSTIEEFWHYYSHIIRPDKLSQNISLQFFRNDSRAMWEDPENCNGGSFYCQIPKGQTKFFWERLLLNLIGEQFPMDVIGVVVTVRQKFDFIYIWHQTTTDDHVKIEICRVLQDVFELPLNSKIGYNTFNPKLQEHQQQFIIQHDGPVCRSKPNLLKTVSQK